MNHSRMTDQRRFTKAEAETVVRKLVHDWANEIGHNLASGQCPSFVAFRQWAEQSGDGCYFRFRHVGGADRVAEWWFAQELKQTWRYK